MKNDPQILAEFLRFKVIEGFKQNNFPLTREYLDRIESELEVVRQTKYEAYFLIVADLTDFMHKAGIRFVVRGSGCGSVIVWGLGISHPWLDPIRYKLPFERFLNPSRVTMPDLDIDIQDARRNEVIDYVVKKYGSERVARIINFGTMGARAAINDVARAMNLPDYQAVAAKITSQVSSSESLADKFLHDLARAHPRLLEFARRVEGKPRHTGKHAAGVVISPEDISNFMPLHYTGSPADRDKDEWEPTTSWDMYDVEAYGFLKMDFLGLKTLTVIDNCVKVINAIRSTRQQPLLDIDKIDRWDAKTWQLIADGKLSGVFQVERSYVRNFAKQMNMMRKDEWQLAIILSIIRPGMMDAGMTEVYLRRANELEAPTPPHPALEKTLCKNFGTFVFQEDLMWVCRDLAGFTLAEADTMRQAVAKKKADQLAKIKPKFAEGAKRLHGLTDEQIDAIWKQMATFAKYGFNQSHAAAYGLVITYMTAWLKANEPLVYMMCLINSESGVGDKEKGYNAKVAEYVEEARARGIEILSPCVKTSSAYCKLDLPRNAIRFGLSLVKKAGTSAVQWILEHCRQTDSFKDFILAGYQIREVAYEAYTDKKGREFPAGTEWKVYTQVGKQDIESLIQAGAFDVFDSDREKLMALVGPIQKIANKYWEQVCKIKMGMKTRTTPEAVKAELDAFTLDEGLIQRAGLETRLQIEREYTGCYLSQSPFEPYRKIIEQQRTITLSQIIEGDWPPPDKASGTLEAILQDYREITIKNGKSQGRQMAFLTFSCIGGDLEAVAFADAWHHVNHPRGPDGKVIKDNIERGKVYIVTLTPDRNGKAACVQDMVRLSNTQYAQ